MRPSFIQALLLATATAAALHSAPASAAATPPPAQPKPTLTDATAEHLGELSKHLEHDDHTALLLLLEKILPTVPPDSFDRALLTQLQGQVLLNAKRYTDAIPTLEISRQLSTGKNWFDPATTRQLHHTLSQLYYQEATQTTDTPTRRAKLRLATQRINEALALSQETRPDDHLYAATLLYTEATLDPAKPDPATLQAAQAAARTSSTQRPQPHEQSLLLTAAIQQQLGHPQHAAETLETLLATHPANADYWRQLFALYTQLATDASDVTTPPSQIRRWQHRALLTQHRARQHNALATPQDHHNTIALLFALQQYQLAAQTLEHNLANGQLPSNRQNWETLAAAWRHQGQPARAIATLRQALQKHPDEPTLHHHLAQLLHDQGQPQDAYTHAHHAAQSKANPKPAETWFLLAYLAYELHRHDDATRHLETAAHQPNPNTPAIRWLRTAIQSAQTKTHP